MNARRRGDELLLVPLDAARRAQAIGLAAELIAIAKDSVGSSRHELEEGWQAAQVAPREQRVALGLRKLIDDRCTFLGATSPDPAALRDTLFVAASAARREGRFMRAELVAAAAARYAVEAAAIDEALYGDLKAAHRLTAVAPLSPAALVEEYEQAQAQAVLLRAVRLQVEVYCQSADAYRALFAKLKFLRLLATISPAGAGYRLDIDGPFSLFESVTKYGLQLGLLLPALRACERFRLEAEVRWGKERTPLRFRLEEKGSGSGEAPPLRDEVARLLAEITAQGGPWRAAPASELFALPGVGLCVPDLLLTGPRRRRVFVEVLGFWSRQAVWRRVELVERGLDQPILFAVGEQLRVSEAALDAAAPAALYVYKRAMSAKTLVERAAALAERTPRKRRRGSS